MPEFVQIIRYEDNMAVKTSGPYSQRRAEKISDEYDINLNHEAFYTLAVTETDLREKA